MSKYDALTAFLRGKDSDRVQVGFAQLADVVPGGLPPSGYNHPAWWAKEARVVTYKPAAGSRPGTRSSR